MMEGESPTFGKTEGKTLNARMMARENNTPGKNTMCIYAIGRTDLGTP